MPAASVLPRHGGGRSSWYRSSLSLRRPLRLGSSRAHGRRRVAVAACVTVLAAFGVSAAVHGATPGPQGIHKIKHVIVIMQENRSFDSYFGTFPGVNGIKMHRGVPVACLPDPKRGHCVRPYLSTADINGGGPHNHAAAVDDVNGGAMNGFARIRDLSLKACNVPQRPACARARATEPQVMGYHNAGQIPNYWEYAKQFVLADNDFEPVSSSSIAAHLYMISGWSAYCTTKSPKSCVNRIVGPDPFHTFDHAVAKELQTGTTSLDLAWTDLTWLLYRHNVSWGYYIQTGTEPDCVNDAAITCPPMAQSYMTPGIWNPLPLFTDVQKDHQVKNVQPLHHFLSQARRGTLPAVSWVVPSGANSEHPPSSVHQGQAFVTALVNAVMKSPDWKSSAIFLSWDDWGGFYDNAVPPKIDMNGYGLRVPLIVISPYAKKGHIDHQVMSSDGFLKFIEDDFIGGQRINPKTDGRWDPRPDVRESAPQLGNLVKDFNFNQPPRPPLLLATNPPTNSPSIPAMFRGAPACVGCTKVPSGGSP